MYIKKGGKNRTKKNISINKRRTMEIKNLKEMKNIKKLFGNIGEVSVSEICVEISSIKRYKVSIKPTSETFDLLGFSLFLNSRNNYEGRLDTINFKKKEITVFISKTKEECKQWKENIKVVM